MPVKPLQLSFLLKIRESVSGAAALTFGAINDSDQRVFPRFRFSPQQCKWSEFGAPSVNVVWVTGGGEAGM